MNNGTKLTFKILGVLALIEGIFMIPCVFAAVYYDELECAKPFFTVSLLCMCFGLLIKGLIRTAKVTVNVRKSYFVVIVSWLFCAFIGLLPMYCSGHDYPFFSCVFESVAAFTTTGCTVIDVNTVPNSLLLWRAICHWLGGMGILVLLISIFPMWGISNQTIANAEMPGTKMDKLESTYTSTGKYLYLIYMGFTLVQYILLVLSPMDSFTALITSFSVISTAGLIVTDANAWMFQIEYVRAIILAFSILSSLNFVIYFLIIKRKTKAALKNMELRIFGGIILVASILITLSLKFMGGYHSLWQAFKDAICQVISFISTSGFMVCDYTTWPTFSIFVLMFLMLCGGCTFSTAGSLKVMRVAVLWKIIRRGMMKHIHPNIINAVVIDKQAIPAKQVSGIISFSLIYFGVYFILCTLLSFSGYDMETVLSTTLAMTSNTGLALGVPGSGGYYGMFNQFSQGVMSFAMLAGRLEMYALLMLFTRAFWKPNKTK